MATRTHRNRALRRVMLATMLLGAAATVYTENSAYTENSDSSSTALAAAPAEARTAKFGRTTGQPFLSTSAFNSRIGANPRVDRRSAAMVGVLAGRGYATAQVYADTPRIYHATAATPRYAMRCTANWGKCDLERRSVPIPAGAVAAKGGYDRSMVVLDWSTRRVYEFWQYNNNKRTASWGAILPIDGSGTGTEGSDTGRYGAVGAGISRLAGIIRTHEIRQGRIEHALVGPTGFSCKNSRRYPAVKTDGWSTASNCIPEGARVQLKRSVICKSLPGIKAWEVTVCRALKNYGWYNIDNGNPGVKGFGIQFENAQGGTSTHSRIGLRDYTPIKHIPLRKLQVLASWNSFG